MYYRYFELIPINSFLKQFDFVIFWNKEILIFVLIVKTNIMIHNFIRRFNANNLNWFQSIHFSSSAGKRSIALISCRFIHPSASLASMHVSSGKRTLPILFSKLKLVLLTYFRRIPAQKEFLKSRPESMKEKIYHERWFHRANDTSRTQETTTYARNNLN